MLFKEKVILEVENKIDPCGTLRFVSCHWTGFFKIFILFNFDIIQTSFRQTAQA